MKMKNDVKLDFCDVLIRPKKSSITSRKDVHLERSFHFRWSSQRWNGIPIITSNMDTIGTRSMVKKWTEAGMLGCLHKFIPTNDAVQFLLHPRVDSTCISIGMNDMQKAQDIIDSVPELTMIVIDVANGYLDGFLRYVSEARKRWPNHILMAGNVVDAKMTSALIKAGADVVKVGIGSGSACTTRQITGVGYPQLSAIIECSRAAHDMGGFIIADGGCTSPGDIAKAFGAGADFVMLGGMLAGHDECEGTIVEDQGKKMLFYGMSSEQSMISHYGEVLPYRASEGREVYVPYRGSIDKTIRQILGGLRSCCTYVGASSIEELPKRTTFIRVNRQLNTIFEEDSIESA